MTKEKLIQIGRIGVPYGIRGWVKVHSYTQSQEDILHYQPWQIRVKHQWQEIKISEGRLHGKGVVVKLPGVKNPEEARLYANASVAIPREQLPELLNDEYYWTDLEGLTVINENGITLGVVHYCMETGSNDVLVVKGEQFHAIPYLPGEVINQIDLKNKTIQVNWDPNF